MSSAHSKTAVGNAALALGLTLLAPLAFAAVRPPPPTNVQVTAVQGIDKNFGSFILQWSPAIDAATGKPYVKYGLSAGCKYEGMDAGTTAGPTGVSGLWQAQVTGTGYRVKVTCSCAVAPYRYNAISTDGPDAYTPRSIWVNTEKFLIPCGGK